MIFTSVKRCCLSLFVTLLLSFLQSFAPKQQWQLMADNPDNLHKAMKKITDVIVHDIYSPPVASRIYAYVSVAGYEAAIHADKNYVSLAGQLHSLTSLPKPDDKQQYNFQFASLHAMLVVARTLMISEQEIKTYDSSVIKQFADAGMPANILDSSLSYGNAVAAHILAWAAKDKYKETRSLPRYAVSDDEGTWKPTPPAYIPAVEPHWNGLRTFIIDSCNEFKPAPAIPFSKDTASRFYKEVKAVYNAGMQLTDEQKAIANFWDCNPFKLNLDGHVHYATKKISPGGHWINITALACRQKHADFIASSEAYVCIAIALADAFISCWDEKYRSNVIRPETYINQYIDESWLPLLQTPPFPEYTSGHSVVSAASSVILTKMFGDNFSYIDSTEEEFELPPRKFTSFKQAAKEAAISRFYGGIHYIPSINNGYDEGEKIGEFVIKKLKTKS